MYDVVVIGGGPGGYAAGIRASQLGGKAALVEAGDLGGTCVNHGCIPSKVWMHAADLMRRIRGSEDFGIKTTVDKVDLQAVVDRKNGVGADIRTGMEALLANNGVELIRGRGVVKGPGKVEVDGKILETKNIILASGSSLHIPDIPGLSENSLTSDQVLNNTETPGSVLIWGAGPIEVEIAGFLNVFGAKVFLATDAPRILPMEDHDTSQRITQALKEQGLEIMTRASLASVQKKNGSCEAVFSAPKEQTLEVEQVVVASRKPDTKGLGLEQAGVKLNEDGGVDVSAKLETSVPGIYAIGDVTGGWMLSHAASAMAVTAAQNIMGQPCDFAFNQVSRGLWTFPEAAAVGLSEEEAEKQGYDVEVGDFPYAINGLAMSRGEIAGSVKIVTESQYGEILGVHIVGSGATELIGEAALAVHLECTAEELAQNIRVHPTFSEAVVDAARDAMGWALYLPKR